MINITKEAKSIFQKEISKEENKKFQVTCCSNEKRR